MSLSARQELVATLNARYQAADRKDKQRILDECIASSGYHRKYAISLLNHSDPPQSHSQCSPRSRSRTYTSEVKDALLIVWQAANRLCSKRLVPFMAEFVSVLERHGHLSLSDDVRNKLLRVSPATVDRLLCDVRHAGKRSGLVTTRPGSLLKHQIPIRTFSDWDDLKPGFVEADLVAHCGSSTQGTYLNSLVLTDVSTQWTEFFALLCRDLHKVTDMLELSRTLLPFPLLGLDTDNGSEFLNHSLLDYCRLQQITFTRCRPYKKNDQCHVEQKNGSLVRKFVGYDRFEGAAACKQLAALYGVLRLYVNFFQPSVKLVSKERKGSKVIKRYDQAQTPYQRVLASKEVADEAKAKLREQYEKLNPVELLSQSEYLQDLLWQHAHRPADWNALSQTTPTPRLNRVEIERPNSEKSPVNRVAAGSDQNRAYRKTRKPTKHSQVVHIWRTRKDPFILVWDKVEARLEENPGLQVKEIFETLQREYPGQFSAGQLRTLQRRVRAWRLARIPSSGLPHGEGVIVPTEMSTLNERELLEDNAFA